MNKYLAMGYYLFLTACAASAAQTTSMEPVDTPRQPRTICRTLDHGIPSGLDAESVAQWARRELNRSDDMIRYCQSSITRLKSHIRGISDVD